MPLSCAFLSCDNKVSKNCKDPARRVHSFHKFPRSQPDVFEKWVCAMHRKDWTPGPISVICSDHFRAENFDETGQTIRLRSGSVPTEFLPASELYQPRLRSRTTQNRLLPSQELVKPVDSGCQEITSFESPRIRVQRTQKLLEPVDNSCQEATSLVSTRKLPRLLPSHKLVNLGDLTNSDAKTLIALEHRYSACPRKVEVELCEKKMMNDEGKDEARRMAVRKKLRTAHQRIRQLRKKVISLYEVVDDLEKDLQVSGEAAELLKKHFRGLRWL